MTGGPKLTDLKLDEKEWPKEKRLKITGRRGWEYVGLIVKELYKQYGVEGIQRVWNNVMIQMAEKYFLPGLKTFNIEGNDCRTVAAYFILADLLVFPDFKGFEVVEDSPNRVVLRSYECPLSRDPAKDLPIEICQNSMGNEETAAKLLNPKIRYFTTKFMNRGDPYCEMGFELVD